MPNPGVPYLLLPVLLLSGCANIGYYGQAIKGHLEISENSTPIDSLLADPNLNHDLAARLRRIKEIVYFARESLKLPDNGSYRKYADLRRPYVTWTLVATEEFSVEPRQWCFPLFGCLSYKGYFHKADAEKEADRLQQAGLDVALNGSTAYSSLGWSRDPVLNTMLARSEERLAETIFHELAHQRLYLKGDTSFNEAFAVTVAMHGTKRWLKQQGHQPALTRYRRNNIRRRQFRQLIRDTRSRLQQTYAGDMSDASKRSRKFRAFKQMRRDYRQLKQSWGGYTGYDNWMEQPLNNAHLALAATYQDLVPLFRQLLERCGYDPEKFYLSAQSLEKIEQSERHRYLQTIGCGNT